MSFEVCRELRCQARSERLVLIWLSVEVSGNDVDVIGSSRPYASVPMYQSKLLLVCIYLH